jgi:peptidyl-prolyl cis-trans isomerase B (cyclophilin B)
VPQNRRQQQHRNQRPVRRRQAVSSGETQRKADVPFPMNLFRNSTMFMIVGVVVMVGGLFLTFLLQTDEGDPLETPPTSTPEAGETVEGTPGETSTPVTNLQWDEPGQAINPQAFNYRATVETAKGSFVIEFYDDVAPNTVNNFVFLAEEGYFDGITFHRVVLEPRPFVAQSGDPTASGSGGPGYLVEEEENDLTNTRGTIAMAKTSGASAFGSQWFVNLSDNTTLDQAGNRFYPFAEVVEGMDVVDQIAQGDVITSITVEEIADPDAPEATATTEGGDEESPTAEGDAEEE